MVSRFGVGITEVAWVLISYNLVLAAGAVPAAHLGRGRSRLLCGLGVVVFSTASLMCGLASSFSVLLAGRCIQAAGAALIVASALVLLGEVEGAERRAAAGWARAGSPRAALGPAVRGGAARTRGGGGPFLSPRPRAPLP